MEPSRYVADDISPFLLQLITNLYDAEISGEVAGPCIKGLAE